MYEQRIENVKTESSACKQIKGTSRIRLYYLKKNLKKVITNAKRRARQEFTKSPDFLAKSKSDVMHITKRIFKLSRKVNQVQLYTQMFPSYP